MNLSDFFYFSSFLFKKFPPFLREIFLIERLKMAKITTYRQQLMSDLNAELNKIRAKWNRDVRKQCLDAIKCKENLNARKE